LVSPLQGGLDFRFFRPIMFPLLPLKHFPARFFPSSHLGSEVLLIACLTILPDRLCGRRIGLPISWCDRKCLACLLHRSGGHLNPTDHGPILYGFSPSVILPSSDWDNNVTGYWFLDPSDDWNPPSALMEYLQAGSSPVYIGFGSMSNRKPEETTDLVFQALTRTKQRAIMLSGWSGLRKSDLPDSVFMVDSVPHSRFLPRVEAVIHHGGAGTTAAGLRAGVPSVIIPFHGDQPFWGQRIAELGVGPVPIPRRRLSVERLAQAIEEAVTDQTMRQHAADLGSKIRAEDGIAREIAVVQHIEKHVSRPAGEMGFYDV